MTFKERIVDDAKDVFLDAETGFAEEITYTPSGGVAKTIKAVVERQMLTPNQQGQKQIPGREADISILNNADQGVSEVNKGKDKVSLPVWAGEESVEWAVVDVISKDEAMFVLRIRR
jgi:hypothetical protein